MDLVFGKPHKDIFTKDNGIKTGNMELESLNITQVLTKVNFITF